MHDATEHLSHFHHEERPWGSFTQFILNEPSTIKRIVVHAGEALSLQRHKNRAEFYYIFSGNGFITVGDKRLEARPGDSFFIPQEGLHRAEGGTEDLIFIEIALGTFDESDIERLEDKYGRH